MKKYCLIACEIMKEEVNYCLQKVDVDIDVKMMPNSLHEVGSIKMKHELQCEIDKVNHTEYDAILLGYGLCSNGIIDLTSPIPLVVPKVHDCIAIFMGSKYKYQEYFDNNIGTFFQSPGWIEKGIDGENVQGLKGFSSKKDEYIEKYGEEEGEYLYEMLGGWRSEYKCLTYIDTVKSNFDYYKAEAKKFAEKNQWKYGEIGGDTRLIMNLLTGNWNTDEFLVVPPNKKIISSYDEDIIKYK